MFNQQVISNFANPNRIGSSQNHSYEKSEKRGFKNPNAFNQNHQLQKIVSLLLPLLQQLISNLGNNDGNDQHCKSQCESKPPQRHQLSDNVRKFLESSRFNPIIFDDDCDGKISAGDTLLSGGFAGTGTRVETIDQALAQILNSLDSTQNPQEIQFDEAYQEPITHLGTGSETPIRSIEFFGDGYQGILENGTGFGTQIAAGGSDPRPRINGQIVTRADYTSDTATYTLENGTTLTGFKHFNPSM